MKDKYFYNFCFHKIKKSNFKKSLKKKKKMDIDEILTLDKIFEKCAKDSKSNLQPDLDNVVSYRFVLYQRETFYKTEKVIERGHWCPSISMSRQSAEVKVKILKN